MNRYIFTSAVSAGGQTVEKGCTRAVQGVGYVRYARGERGEERLQMGVQGVCRVSVTSVTIEVSAGKRDCKGVYRGCAGCRLP